MHDSSQLWKGARNSAKLPAESFTLEVFHIIFWMYMLQNHSDFVAQFSLCPV